MKFVVFLIHFVTNSYLQKEMNMFSTYFVKRRPNHFERNLKDLSPNFFLLYLFNIFLHKITLKEMIMWSAFSLICLVYFFDQVFQYLYKMSTPHIVCVNCLEISGSSSPLGTGGNSPPPPILASIETKPVPLND